MPTSFWGKSSADYPVAVPIGLTLNTAPLPKDFYRKSPMTKHPDINKRVKWTRGSERGFGTLMAVNWDSSSRPHLVRREDDRGWKSEESDGAKHFAYARSQGVQDGTKNLYWVESYELMNRTIDDVKRGDWLVRCDREYRRVFDVRGEGELALVDLSYACKSKDSDDTKAYCSTSTLHELKNLGYTLEDESPDAPVEMTVAEIRKKFGVTVKVVE